MGVMNRIMNLIGLQEEEEVIERERIVETAEEPETSPSDFRTKNKGNIVSIHSQKNMKVVLCEPKQYDDSSEAQEITDHLRSRRSVVVNLHRASKSDARRILDFLSGTVYALNGTINKVGPDIFLCTPDTVDIQGEISPTPSSEETTN